MAKSKSKTHYSDKAIALKEMLINIIKKNVKKLGDPHIYVGEDDEASFEVEHNRYVFCLKEDCFTDHLHDKYQYELLDVEQLGILADFSSNI